MRILSTESIAFSYKESEILEFPDIVLDEVEDLLILGKSGVGKTTLLHLLGGLLDPSKGSINIKGTAINSLGNATRDRFRGEHIGYIFQTAHFISSLTVEENLKLAVHLSAKKVASDRIHNLLKELNIFQYRNKLPSRLSIGEQQRLSIARAIVHKPDILLADEPTSSLDDDHCKDVIELLKAEAHKNEISLIVVTHDARLKKAFKNCIEL